MRWLAAGGGEWAGLGPACSIAAAVFFDFYDGSERGGEGGRGEERETGEE